MVEEKRVNRQPAKPRRRSSPKTSQEGVLVLNIDSGIIKEANPHLLKMLGYTPQEILGAHP